MSNKELLVEKYKQGIDEIFNLAGTDIEIWTREVNPNIVVDPISGEPLNPDESPWILTLVPVQGVARWATPEMIKSFPGGAVFEDDVIVMFYANDVMVDPSDPSLGTIVDNSEYVVVDDVKCNIKGTPRRSGFPTVYVYHIVFSRFE
jgi:hypothetical protein